MKDSEAFAGLGKSAFLSHDSFLCALETSSDIRENAFHFLFTIFVSGARLADNLYEILGSDGAHLVIEATGAPPLAKTAFQLAAEKGRVVLLGSTRGETEYVNFYRDVHRKGLHIIGAHEITRPRHENSPGYWTQISEHRVCLELLARGRVDVTPLITHCYNWRDFATAYAHLAAWDKEAQGILIEWV